MHDFSLRQAGSRLVEALKRKRNASTVADLVADTGLPKVQVESTIRHVLDEYGGQLKVTETGELLYYFPHGMRSRTRGFGPSLRRAAGSFLRGAGRVLSLLFKVWILLMLVGYTVLFALILLAAVFVSFAAAASGRGDDRGRSRGGGGFGGGMGGGFGGMYLATRLFQLFLFMWMVDAPAGRYPGRSFGPGGPWDRPARGAARAPRRPLYRSVFAYVFGEEDPNRGWEERERIRVIAFLRRRKGVIGLEELMALTGRGPAQAQALMNALLVELDGEPSVTEAGTLVFLFPGLLASAEPQGGPPSSAPESSFLPPADGRKPLRFNANPARTNGWITFFNGFNLLSGGYFLYFSGLPPVPGQGFASLYLGLERALGQAGAEPAIALGIVLGAVPFVFSLLFFLVPLLRAAWIRRINESIRRENLRRAVYFQVLADPGEVDPRQIRPASAEERPKEPQREVRRVLDELAAFKQADIEPAEDGHLLYRFPELARELADLAAYRRSIDPSRFDVGRTVFDSGEDPAPQE